jgi:tetratricopeptide (TPR) repeat protein
MEVAAWYAREGTIEGYQHAERWDPGNPAYPEAKARLRGKYVETADAHAMALDLEKATREGPQRAFPWANLAEAYELNGQIGAAETAFDRALEIFPKSPEINWMYANYLVQTGYTTAAFHPLGEAILGDAKLRAGAFDLALRSGASEEEILQMIPTRQDILSAYLDYLTGTRRLDAAQKVWERLVASPNAFDLDAAFRYFDALLDAQRVDGMWTVWTDLARHDPAKIHWGPGKGNLIQNGGFELPILNGGFSWRIVPINGATIAVDGTTAHTDKHSLEIKFEGKQNLEFGNVVQYVAVEPLTSYRFDAYVRTEGITTDSGPRIAIYDPYDHAALSMQTANLLGTTGWKEQALAFRTEPETRLIVVEVYRPRSAKLDNQIAGTVWLDDISLTASP